MHAMGWSLLLLLAALACTAAEDTPGDIDNNDVKEAEEVSSRAESIDEMLNEMPGDAEDEMSRRHYGYGVHSHGFGGGCVVGNGATYRGYVSVTKSGRRCQRWRAQTPHSHKYTPARYKASGLEKNFCRNPSNHYTGIWCYTTDPKKRWENCDVPACECQVGNGAFYRGAVAVTETGRPCQRWDAQAPHKHRYKPAKYWKSGLEQNFCRNPSGHTKAWCYTQDSTSRWENCAIPGCECQIGNGASYRGVVAVTESGRTCQRWDDQQPHKHKYKPSRYRKSGLEQNFCRNPSNHYTGIWCYTQDPKKRWENCRVSGCGKAESGVPEKREVPSKAMSMDDSDFDDSDVDGAHDVDETVGEGESQVDEDEILQNIEDILEDLREIEDEQDVEEEEGLEEDEADDMFAREFDDMSVTEEEQEEQVDEIVREIDETLENLREIEDEQDDEVDEEDLEEGELDDLFAREVDDMSFAEEEKEDQVDGNEALDDIEEALEELSDIEDMFGME